MLSRFLPDYNGKTQDELTAFLEAMEREGAVERSGNQWKLVTEK
jgi:hypothetical protein